MAPGYRNQNRRQNRTGYVDHDVFEGLPVRHWRRDYVTVAPPPIQESNSTQNDIWAVELPHGMPKDSHLLPQHSQDLLRAARSGKIYKRPAPVEEEEVDVEVVLGEKPDKKEEDPKDKGFTARAWKQIPRHMEGPDVEYLAKRRKGLITITAKTAPAGPTLTKTTVKRIDAAGNEYVQDVVVPHGQQVEGEVISQTVIPASNTTVDPYTVQPTPPKRKAGSSKKKLKGPGRGRKKKSAAPTSVPDTMPVEGGSSVAAGSGIIGSDGVKLEGTAPGTTLVNNEDTEMGEGSIANSSDEEGEEGDDNDDDEGSTDNQNSPSKPIVTVSPTPITIPDLNQQDVSMQNTEFGRPPPKLLIEPQRPDGKSGSPLKNIALTTSNLTSPSEPVAEPSFSSMVAAPVSLETPPVEGPIAGDIVETMQQEMLQSPLDDLPIPPPDPTEVEVEVAVDEKKAEEEEESMLLEITHTLANSSNAEPENANFVPLLMETEVPSAQIISSGNPTEIFPTETEIFKEVTPPITQPSVTSPSILEAHLGIADHEEDDDFPDLLGGLEKSLESSRQASVPQTNLATEDDETTDGGKGETINPEKAEGI